MTGYIVQRTAQMLLVVFSVVTLTFFVLRLASGDPARLMNRPGTPEDAIQLTRQRIGTDKPLLVQYRNFLAGLARGDLGVSFRGEQSVAAAIAAALPNTLLLGTMTMIVASLVGLGLGLAAALRPNSLVDRAILVYVALAQATPNFWLGVVLVLVFSIHLRWLPAIDMSGPQSFILPVATLAITLTPLLIRAVRQSFLETLGEDFVRAARARGLSERRIRFVHTLKVAAIPLVTLIGLQAGFVLGGAYVVESIFNWPGLGKLTLDAIASRDFPLIQGGVLVVAVVFVVVNFAVDLLYTVLDPRIRY
ncbi:MAG TPA: ABC transporter permease [Caldilineaceae bacterium]|nr:ABC transporter permease [Caldilineaceae bacterium]